MLYLQHGRHDVKCKPSIKKGNRTLECSSGFITVEGDRGRESGRIRAGDGREGGGDGAGCGSHARAGCRKRMRDIKFFNDLLVCFWASYQKSEPKNIDYLLF